MSFTNTTGSEAYLEQIVTIINPTDRQLIGRWNGDVFAINPNSEEQVPMWLAKHLMRHLGTIDGKPALKMSETVKVTCGVCQKQFDTKRELGAHSLTHRKSNKE